jgi:hypothetical protein
MKEEHKMGRLPGEEPRQYQIQQLWELHHEILRRLVIGQKSVDIARDLNVTAPVVSYVKNSEVGRKQLSLMRSAANVSAIDVAGHIRELAGKAVAVMEECLEGDHPMSTKFRAAADVLDRAGFGAPKIIRSENIHAHLTADDIEQIKQRAKSEMALCGILALECEVE